MAYPKEPKIHELAGKIIEYGRLVHEYGGRGVADAWIDMEEKMKETLERLQSLPIDAKLKEQEPDDLPSIRALRAEGPRRLWGSFNKEVYMEKLEGALLARFAGCTLGAPVEFWGVSDMEKWAAYIGDAFPPRHYWSKIKNPNDVRYGKSTFYEYTLEGLTQVPVDDDITYTILGLLIAEEHGLHFTTEDVGRSWLKYLPVACTAEEVALNNLKAGIPALQAADVNNPFCQWIGADIRSDPWAYMAPAYPAKAAEYAYRDAYLSHRRNGIYGEMFFSAAQSAAFAVDHPEQALRIGLTEIPKDCSLYKDVEWALDASSGIHDYKEARAAVDERFKGMSGVHTNNNACLTVFGLMIGGTDVSKVISETVAMGLDNDCTAATAGSIVGAIAGKSGVPEHWYKPFHDTVTTYMTNAEKFKISDLVDRYTILAGSTHHEA
ncbi:ADP-ribosylglycohydrolase [Paenibacillus rhizosphaerae]|uniref:ADP-ribosylglycohydrolase n=1 Tax=Paenibacillus rhizosphaerae TaxID=297318 RepID=A0A839TMC6_9BACL|nr:ADP-ribosylglycohydrolase family protein [Paenibacillus rhizosphaerae]MBB3127822.1 ADP-ribosylglycohydrolase [Paenibacillus rhizosphaerae]